MTVSQAWGSEHHVICSQNPTSTRKMLVTVDMKWGLVHQPGYSMRHHVLMVVQILIACINEKRLIKPIFISETHYVLEYLNIHQSKKDINIKNDRIWNKILTFSAQEDDLFIYVFIYFFIF
jgi:hypothetical protein